MVLRVPGIGTSVSFVTSLMLFGEMYPAREWEEENRSSRNIVLEKNIKSVLKLIPNQQVQPGRISIKQRLIPCIVHEHCTDLYKQK